MYIMYIVYAEAVIIYYIVVAAVTAHNKDNRNIILNAFKYKHLTTYRKQGPLTEKKIYYIGFILYIQTYMQTYSRDPVSI